MAVQILRALALGTALLALGPTSWAQSLTAQQVQDSLGVLRDEAAPLWEAGDPRGLELLDHAWALVESPAGGDLARGSVELRSRVFNLALETACAHAVRADTAAALRALGRVVEWGAPPLMAAVVERRCPPLYALRGEPAYQQVLALWRSEDRRQGGIETPFRDSLSVDERVAGLSLLWSRVRTGLPGFHTRPGLDLDSLYLAALPAVRAAASTFAYYRVLERFAAELRDGHTGVSFPDTLARRRYARPPLRTALVEGRVVVTDVLDAERADLAVGTEVLEVDG